MGLGQQCSRFHDTTLYLRGNMVEFRTAVSDVHDEELAVEHDGIWNVGYQHGGAMPTMGRVGAGRQKAIMCGQHGVKQEARMRWRNGVAEFLRCVIRFRERRPEDDWAGVDCLMEGAQKKKKKRQKKEPAVKTPDTREKKKKKKEEWARGQMKKKNKKRRKDGPEAKWRGKKKNSFSLEQQGNLVIAFRWEADAGHGDAKQGAAGATAASGTGILTGSQRLLGAGTGDGL
jgi:hypothetical protein